MSDEQGLGLRNALELVRQKHIEEIKGITEGGIADAYAQACAIYPVMMKTAHHLWAIEVAKSEFARPQRLDAGPPLPEVPQGPMKMEDRTDEH